MGIFKPDPQKMMEKGDIEGLTKALKSKDPSVRGGAISGLGLLAMGGWYAHASNPVIRKKACWALVDAIREPIDAHVTVEAIKVLVGLYKSGELPSELRKPVQVFTKMLC